MDHPHARVSYLTAVDFAKHCLTAITEGTVDHFRTRMLALDLLAVDDVHMLSRFVRMELLYLLRMMRRRRRTVFLAGTSHPSTLVTECEEREAAFASWRVLPLSMPTPATRREIARRKAHGTGCTLSADIIDYLARDIGDLKELNLALEAITERAALEGVPVDLPMVAATVEPMKRGGAAVLGIERITSVVTSILAGDQSACATPRDLRPSLVAYFARELTSLSLAQVGYASGLGIEPVRVLRAINDVHDWIATRSDVRALVASARAALLLPPRLQPSAGESDAHGVNVSSHLRSDGR